MEFLPVEAIKNCFLHCFKNESGNVAEFGEFVGANEIRGHTDLNATENGVTLIRTGIDRILIPHEEDDVVESVSFEELSRAAAGVEDFISEEPQKDSSLETAGLYTLDEYLKGLAVSNASLERFGLQNADLITKRFGSRGELRVQKSTI